MKQGKEIPDIKQFAIIALCFAKSLFVLAKQCKICVIFI
jgi:hypothetical protein